MVATCDGALEAARVEDVAKVDFLPDGITYCGECRKDLALTYG